MSAKGLSRNEYLIDRVNYNSLRKGFGEKVPTPAIPGGIHKIKNLAMQQISISGTQYLITGSTIKIYDNIYVELLELTVNDNYGYLNIFDSLARMFMTPIENTNIYEIISDISLLVKPFTGTIKLDNSNIQYIDIDITKPFPMLYNSIDIDSKDSSQIYNTKYGDTIYAIDAATRSDTRSETTINDAYIEKIFNTNINFLTGNTSSSKVVVQSISGDTSLLDMVTCKTGYPEYNLYNKNKTIEFIVFKLNVLNCRAGEVPAAEENSTTASRKNWSHPTPPRLQAELPSSGIINISIADFITNITKYETNCKAMLQQRGWGTTKKGQTAFYKKLFSVDTKTEKEMGLFPELCQYILSIMKIQFLLKMPKVEGSETTINKRGVINVNIGKESDSVNMYINTNIIKFMRYEFTDNDNIKIIFTPGNDNKNIKNTIKNLLETMNPTLNKKVTKRIDAFIYWLNNAVNPSIRFINSINCNKPTELSGLELFSQYMLTRIVKSFSGNSRLNTFGGGEEDNFFWNFNCYLNDGNNQIINETNIYSQNKAVVSNSDDVVETLAYKPQTIVNDIKTIKFSTEDDDLTNIKWNISSFSNDDINIYWYEIWWKDSDKLIYNLSKNLPSYHSLFSTVPLTARRTTVDGTRDRDDDIAGTVVASPTRNDSYLNTTNASANNARVNITPQQHPALHVISEWKRTIILLQWVTTEQFAKLTNDLKLLVEEINSKFSDKTTNIKKLINNSHKTLKTIMIQYPYYYSIFSPFFLYLISYII